MTFYQWFSGDPVLWKLDRDVLAQEAWEAATVAERERCAKVCEEEHVGESLTDNDLSDEDLAYNSALVHAAAAIRAGAP